MNATRALGPGEYIGAGKQTEVRLAPRGTNLFAGTITATSTPQAIGSQPCKEVLVQADPANGVNVLVGPSGSQPVALTPGSALVVDVIDVSLLFCVAPTGAPVVNWIALV